MRVLVATEKPFDALAVKPICSLLEKAGIDCLFLERYPNKQVLLEAVSDVDALIVRSDKVDAEVLDAAKNLKIVVRAGSGYDNVDCAAAAKRQIVVMNTPGQNANAVAELVIAYALLALRNQFNGKAGHELLNKKMGLVGFGAIPKAIVARAKGFNLDFLAFSRSLTSEIASQYGAECAQSIDEIFASCSLVSLNIPSTEQTKNSIQYDLISSMPQGAMLINTARADVVNEDDLFQVMTERSDFVYMADVAPKNRERFESNFAGRVFFSPKKLGAQTLEANINAGVAAARQIVAYFSENDTTYQVN